MTAKNKVKRERGRERERETKCQQVRRDKAKGSQKGRYILELLESGQARMRTRRQTRVIRSSEGEAGWAKKKKIKLAK